MGLFARKRSAIVAVVSTSGCERRPLLTAALVTPTPLPGVSESEIATPTSAGHTVPTCPIVLDGVAVTETTTISFTITEQEEYLFDTPTLQGEPVTAQSVEEARFDLLDRVTEGRNCASLTFLTPEGAPPWLLVFDPEHDGGVYVARRVEVRMERG